MNADQCGTISERKRNAAGWYTATDRPMCQACSHVEANYPDRSPPYDKPTYRCKLNDFATKAGAACQSFLK